MSNIREVQCGGKTIQFEFNRFAKQANGSVMVTSGGTQVLVTVCAAKDAEPGLDFFPLGVDYIEKSYAVGKFPGGYVKREGKPTDQASLYARVIDRPLRPCFPKGYQNETVITATVMSYELGYSPIPLAVAGASAALCVSDIPFEGPVAALRIGLVDGAFVIDPPEDKESDLDLTIACKPNAVLMVEAGANFLSSEKMLEAIEFAHKAMEPIFALQLQVQEEFGKKKMLLKAAKQDEELQGKIKSFATPLISEAFAIKDKLERYSRLDEVEKLVEREFTSDSLQSSVVQALYHKLKSMVLRDKVLDEKERIDGRGLKDIRPIQCDVGVLKQPHGSSLFTRGETQALATVTLAAVEEQQKTEALWSADLKHRFFLHYNFPPFSVGEARMQRSPGRREIGHGSLARRALEHTIPDVDDFTYAIRVVSETLESNGSSSMAAVCSGSMALLHAGVPVKKPVAGIAMGLIKEGEKYSILSDILGDEDHLGDMDFKVCGTEDAITALQMDIKISGITMDLMREALDQAQEGRRHILGLMNQCIKEPSELSKNAPRIFKLKIKPDKIRDIIGPGGKTIKKISTDTGVRIDVEDQGMINISAPDATSAQAAKSMIRSYISQPQLGDVYLGKVVRIVDFGAFIELRPGLDGLCHLSQLSEDKVQSADEIVKIGDEVLVKIVDVDRQGRIKLSRKEALGEQPTLS